MFNFSGVFYRIWGVSAVIFFVGLLLFLFEKPWSKSFKLKNCKIALFIVAFALCLGLFYASRIVARDVSSYTGEFVESHRNSRVAPPLPFTNEYVFWNGTGEKKVVYVDTFSKKKIFESELSIGTEYTVYFDKITKVIVYVEIAEK